MGLLVIAEDYGDFVQFLKRHKIQVLSKPFLYAASPGHLLGVDRGTPVLVLGYPKPVMEWVHILHHRNLVILSEATSVDH